MKRILLITCCIAMLAGCGMSENKEARIQKLETQTEQLTVKIELLDSRMQTLESNAATITE